MAQTQLDPAEGFTTQPARVLPPVRRFSLADFSTHPWIRDRVVQFFPHLTPFQVDGFLRSQLYSPEFLFLFMPHAVGYAQCRNDVLFEPTPVIVERFVICQDPQNAEHMEEAASFYDEMAMWAKSKSSLLLQVGEHTDVPLEMIAKRFKRKMDEVPMHFVRLGRR